MKKYEKILLFIFLIAAISMIIISCGKKITGNSSENEYDKVNSTGIRIGKFKYTHIDSVPQIVDRYILEKASQLNCNGIS